MNEETVAQAKARFAKLEGLVEKVKAQPESVMQQEELWHQMTRWEGTAYAVFVAVQRERESLR